jgi:hypothetical protein
VRSCLTLDLGLRVCGRSRGILRLTTREVVVFEEFKVLTLQRVF